MYLPTDEKANYNAVKLLFFITKFTTMSVVVFRGQSVVSSKAVCATLCHCLLGWHCRFSRNGSVNLQEVFW